MQLSTNKIKPAEVNLKLDEDTKALLKKWTIDLEDLIAEYLRDISHEISERIREFGHAHRSPIPLNRQMELQIISRDLRLHLFRTSRVLNILRFVPSGIFPAYFLHNLVTGGAALALTGPAFIAAGVGAAIILALVLYSISERKKQEKSEAVNEAEKDMRPFNYYVAHAIRIEFEDILHLSENALQNVFKEIRKSERKRITINNSYPTIKAIHEDSLLEKIRSNRESLKSVRL